MTENKLEDLIAISVTPEEKKEEAKSLVEKPEDVGSIVATSVEKSITPRKIADTMMTLDEIRAIPIEHYPIIMYCDGGSLFGWLIRKVDKSAASHMQTLYAPDKIATQALYFKTIPVEELAMYNTKLIWNPEWTPEQRKKMIDLIEERLSLSKWKTRYDIWGVFGEALNIEWLQSKKFDFCSEVIGRMIQLVDPVFEKWLGEHKSPTPREVNIYTKSHNPPYQVYGRYFVDDADEIPKDVNYSQKAA